MDYTELYYSEVVGSSPGERTKAYQQTKAVFHYLEDANVTSAGILHFLQNAPQKEALAFSDLPDWLWENSLLKKDTFYYHRRLHVLSAPPKYDLMTNTITKTPFSMEMLIGFTLEDLADYYYEKARVPPELLDTKRDLGALTHLLQRYGKIRFVESVDFVLALIDYAAQKTQEGYKIMDVFSVKSWEGNVHDLLKARTLEAAVGKKNRIRWRECV